MTKQWATVLFVSALICGVGLAETASFIMTGNWDVEITLGENHVQHKLRFEAQGEGNGALQLMDPNAVVWGAKPSAAKWTRGDGNAITFSAPMEFPLGNVGRDAGTLMFRGKFESADLITGEVEFSPSVGDGPSKHGTFKAVRAK